MDSLFEFLDQDPERQPFMRSNESQEGVNDVDGAGGLGVQSQISQFIIPKIDSGADSQHHYMINLDSKKVLLVEVGMAAEPYGQENLSETLLDLLPKETEPPPKRESELTLLFRRIEIYFRLLKWRLQRFLADLE